jgi:hypothetical protein
MRGMRIASLVVVLSVVSCGGKKDSSGSGSSSAGSSMAGSSMAGSSAGSSMAGSDMAGSSMAGSSVAGSGMAGSDMAGSAVAMGSDDDPTMAHKAGMCPSTVFGSTTKAELKGKSVIITVTATDDPAIKAIQARGDLVVHERQDNLNPGTTADVHDMKGTHGGRKGMCPIYVTEGGKMDVKNDVKGIVVTLTPKDHVNDLKTTIDGRITKIADWLSKHVAGGDRGHGGVGGGSGADGMNRSGRGDGLGRQRHGGSGGGGGDGTGGGGGKGMGGGNGGGSDH